MLPASFAACGVLLLALFVVLMGCASFGDGSPLPGEVANPVKNAVLCDCECDPPSGPVAVPWKNFVFAGEDDATQGKIDGNQIPLGQNTVGLRFRQLGVPRFSTITSAKITFTAAAPSASGTASLQIHIVDSANADAFGPPLVDLDALPLIAGHVDWPAGQWAKVGDAEQTEDLASLLQAIVSKQDYTPNSAVAFIIKGSGARTATAFESNNLDPAFLHVDYVPHKAAQQFVTCADPADAADNVKAAAFCQNTVQNTVSHLAQQCRLANACTCKLKDADATQFSAVCKQQPPCEPKAAPQDCDPSGLAVATHAPEIGRAHV